MSYINDELMSLAETMLKYGDDGEDGIEESFDPDSYFGERKDVVEVSLVPDSDEAEFDIESIFNPSKNKQSAPTPVQSPFPDLGDSNPSPAIQPTVSTQQQPNIPQDLTIQPEVYHISQPPAQLQQFETSSADAGDQPHFANVTVEDQIKKQLEQMKSFGTEMTEEQKNIVISSASSSTPQTSGASVLDEDDDEIPFKDEEEIHISQINDMKDQSPVRDFSQPDMPLTGGYLSDSYFTSETSAPSPQSNYEATQSAPVASGASSLGYLGTDKVLALKTAPVAKPAMLNLDTFVDKEKSIGDAYVEGVELIPYGPNLEKLRAKFTLIVANGKKVNATTFNVTPDMTKEVLQQNIGLVFKFHGNWNLYNNNRDFNFHNVSEPDTVASDFIEGDTDFTQYDNLYKIMRESLTDSGLAAVLDTVLFDYDYMKKMKESAAATSNHDSGKGGLWMHSTKVAWSTHTSSILYPLVDHDTAVVGAYLHDIGKVQEISGGEYTVTGELIGHMPLGYSTVKEVCKILSRDYPTLTNEKIINLLHIILSHHGTLEWGSPVVPKTPEAILVHSCDYQESRMQGTSEALNGDGKSYSKMLRHNVFDMSKITV